MPAARRTRTPTPCSVAWVPASLQGLQRAGVSYRDMPGAPQVETSLIWRGDAPPVVARFVGHVAAMPEVTAGKPGHP